MAKRVHTMGPSAAAAGLTGGSGLYDSMANADHHKPGGSAGDPRFTRRAGTKTAKPKHAKAAHPKGKKGGKRAKPAAVNPDTLKDPDTMGEDDGDADEAAAA